MSRWHQMLKEIREPPEAVRIVQKVQKENKDKGFEHSGHFEHGREGSNSLFFDTGAYQERAAIIEANGIPREWAEGYATLCTMPRPAEYASKGWRQIVDDSGYFLDEWGRKAATLGWRAVDVFGVYPSAPECRYDGMGLVLVLSGRRICAITADTARIDCGKGAHLTFYRKTTTARAVAIWEMGSRTCAIGPRVPLVKSMG